MILEKKLETLIDLFTHSNYSKLNSLQQNTNKLFPRVLQTGNNNYRGSNY